MAERVDPVPVDSGDRAVGPHAHVAGHQLDADHRPGLQLRRIAHAVLRRAAGRNPLLRFESELTQTGGKLFYRRRGKSAQGKRCRNFGHAGIAGARLPASRQKRRHIRRRPARRCCAVHAHHFLDRPDPRDGILRIRKCQRHCADELAVDIHRTAAHALHDSGTLQRTAGQLSKNQRFLRAGVIQHTQNLNLKFLNLVTAENRLADAVHACPHFLERHDIKGGVGRSRVNYQHQRRGNCVAHHIHSVVAAARCGASRTRNVGKATSVSTWQLRASYRFLAGTISS